MASGITAADAIQSAEVKEPKAGGESLAVLAHLAPAVEAIADRRLSRILNACATRLPWTHGPYKLPPAIAGRNAFVELAGPDGLAYCADCRFGLYLHAPHCLYPSHHHAADELYRVLSGAAQWQIDDGIFAAVEAGAFIHHRSWQRHAMRTREEPLLAMWTWTGDISAATYSIDG